jgi:hypothetical protein
LRNNKQADQRDQDAVKRLYSSDQRDRLTKALEEHLRAIRQMKLKGAEDKE